MEKENLISLTKKLGLEDKVEFKGMINNNQLPKFYKKADIFVIPSIDLDGKTEGLGVVTMEAMSSGIPVVGSDVGGIPDVIRDGINGFLVPEKSPEVLSSQIIKLLNDKKTYEAFSKNGRKTVEIKFSWESISAKFNKIFSYG